MNSNKPKIVLGMSGGVDSSVCAYLLKQQGYDVVGLFMQNWDNVVNYDIKGQVNSNQTTCDAAKDFSDAQAVAKNLNIPIHYTEFINEYWNEVFQYVINEYQNGRTPNPDILCNKYIKFDHFIQYAKNHLNCDRIAMGHYANVEYLDGEYYLTKAKDEFKDQTYFLCWLNQEQLAKVIFPLGNLNKTEVRKIAETNNFINWNKKDSTGICFIGERKFKEFLQNYIKPKKGNVIDIVSKQKVGTHEGIMFYTIGQNRSLGLGGLTTKYFVCVKDLKNNILYVCDKDHKDQYLTSTKAKLIKFNWINSHPERFTKKPLQVRFRHTGKLVNCTCQIKDDQVLINFDPTLMVVPGQFAVLYDGKYCLGGGIIDTVQ